jgi:transcriptional regulator with XRE-family HTH domain
MAIGRAVVSRKSGAALRAFLVPKIRPTDLARKAGVSPQYVYAVLNGKRPASRRLIDAAAELGLPIALIFDLPAKTERGGEASEAHGPTVAKGRRT